MNKNKGVLGLLLGMSLLSTCVYSQNVTLSLATDKAHYDINENIDLVLTIKADQQVNAGVVSIKGVEQFDLISQSNGTNIENINGAVNVLNQLNISLSAKAAGEYILGPAQTQIGGGIKESNSITISISGEKMFIGNSAPNYTSDPVVNTPVGNSKDSLDSKQNTYSFVPFIIALGVLALAFFLARKLKNKNKDIGNQDQRKAEAKIVFPKVDDPKFTSKITKIVNLIVQRIVGIDVASMTYSEIKRLASFKNIDDEKKNTIDTIFELLSIQKYSNSEIDRKDLLKMIKKI